MYGFNTTLAEDVERFRFPRSLPGAYVFVQCYQPILGSPPADLHGFFDDRADALMSELVRILFRQNMKSMENYYRWLAVQYASQCGRIHQGLIETLFRYNGRSRMGGFLDRLGKLCGGDEVVAGGAYTQRFNGRHRLSGHWLPRRHSTPVVETEAGAF
jgi:hypothetical protein